MFNKNIGLLLLGIWLVLTGIVHFIPSVAFDGFNVVLALLAIVSGILIILNK